MGQGLRPRFGQVEVERPGTLLIDLEKDDRLACRQQSVLEPALDHVVICLGDGSCGQSLGMILEQCLLVVRRGHCGSIDDLFVNVHGVQAGSHVHRRELVGCLILHNVRHVPQRRLLVDHINANLVWTKLAAV